MKSESKNGTYVAVLIIVAISAGMYFYYKGSPNDAATSSLETLNTPEAADAQQVGNRVLALLDQINSLKIDGSIFNDPAYKTLVDYSITVPEQPVGRANPFGPIPGSPATTKSQ